MEQVLLELRKKRSFDSNRWITEKISLLNNYFEENNLSCCVVSVSGGIDSAVVYGLSILASRQENSPIKKVVGIAQPIKSTESIWKRALELEEVFGQKIYIIEQSDTFDIISDRVKKTLNHLESDSNLIFADGQLKSYMRTPINYYMAQVMSSKGYPAVVMGTGNYDEDGYLYYFCKAGDGVVDVQIISDLHKSEVFNVGNKIGVPVSILRAKPSADLWEGQTDEEEMGITYDFVELYTELLKLSFEEQEKYLQIIQEEGDMEKYEEMKNRAVKIHERNKHKVNFPVNL